MTNCNLANSASQIYDINFQFNITWIGFLIMSVHYGSQSCNLKLFVTISEKRSLSHEPWKLIKYKVIEGTEFNYIEPGKGL